MRIYEYCYQPVYKCNSKIAKTNKPSWKDVDDQCEKEKGTRIPAPNTPDRNKAFWDNFAKEIEESGFDSLALNSMGDFKSILGALSLQSGSRFHSEIDKIKKSPESNKVKNWDRDFYEDIQKKAYQNVNKYFKG